MRRRTLLNSAPKFGIEIAKTTETEDSITEITPFLFLSCDATNTEVKKQVDAREDIQHYFLIGDNATKFEKFDSANGREIRIKDDPNEDFLSALQEALEFTRQVVKNNGKLLVHCHKGVSRSASLVIGILMFNQEYLPSNIGRTYKEIENFVFTKRPIIQPVFRMQLEKLSTLQQGGKVEDETISMGSTFNSSQNTFDSAQKYIDFIINQSKVETLEEDSTSQKNRSPRNM